MGWGKTTKGDESRDMVAFSPIMGGKRKIPKDLKLLVKNIFIKYLRHEPTEKVFAVLEQHYQSVVKCKAYRHTLFKSAVTYHKEIKLK